MKMINRSYASVLRGRRIGCVAAIFGIAGCLSIGSLPAAASAGTAKEGTINRAAPAFVPAPASPESVFSDAPRDEEISRARIFAEPLVPTSAGSASTPAENRALGKALAAYQKARLAAGPSLANTVDLLACEQFLQTYPHSRWRMALQTDLGIEYFQRAVFSKALAAWHDAWNIGQSEKEPRAAALASRALAELARMEARLGEVSRLETLLKDNASRSMDGKTAALYKESTECLWTMQHHPEESFKCGPWALDSILSAANPTQPYRVKIKEVASPVGGLSLSAVAALAKEMNMDLAPAKRAGLSAAVPVPAVVHWKLNHYGALLKKEGNRYLLQDPTFGGNPQWISQATLDEESSGYFLVPAKTLAAAGWQSVSEAEGQTTHGKGTPTSKSGGSCGPLAPKAGGGSGGGPKPGKPPKPPKCPTDAGGPGGGDPVGGMASYDIFLMTGSLNITDAPVGYAPSLGPSVYFNLNYGTLEDNQPSTLNFSNFGTRWNFDWITTLTFDSNDAYVACGKGGIETFPNFTASTTTSTPTLEAHTRIVNAGNNVYQELFPDGSMRVFGVHDGAGRYYMTQFTDEQGNAVQLGYDNQYRVITITDALSQITKISYDNAADSLKITKITDPFNRTALFDYDANNRLVKISDAVGLTSQFGYVGATDAIQSLTTGYGTTNFAFTQNGLDATLTVTLPDGSKEMVQTLGGPTSNVPVSETVTPKGMVVLNNYLNNRNTYYWDRKAMLEAPGDLTKAHLTHFCHGDNLSEGLIVDSKKEPLENRVWFRYQGQNQPSFTNAGTLDNPTQVGRVLDDGTTQLTQFTYNDSGNVTQITDPVGRTTNYVYDPTGVDLLEIHQLTNGGKSDELLRSYTYNNQHRPLTITNAAGKTATVTYNAAGQNLTTTDEKQNTTTFTYNAIHQLTSISGPLAGGTSAVFLTYDNVGRIKTQTDALGYAVTYNYDNLNRVTSMVYPDNTQETFTYTLLDLTQRTDRLNRTTYFTYDSLDQLVKMVDPLNQEFALNYCKCGKLSSISDGFSRTTSYDYDIQGRKTAKIYPDGSKTTYQYEATTSRLKTRTDANQQTKSYQYNIDDSIAAVLYGPSQTLQPLISYTYDPDYVRRISYRDAIGTTTYTYHPVTSPPTLGALKLATVKGPYGEIDLGYDELSRVVSRTVNGAKETTTYDSLARVSSISNALGFFPYTYVNNTRQLASIGLPNGVTSYFTYFGNTGDNRLQRIQHVLPNRTVLSQWDYIYGATGLIGSWSQSRTAAPAKVWTLNYDQDEQLSDVAVSGSASSYGYTYDAAGNRTSETINGAASSATYNDLNELVSASPIQESDRTYEWDGEHRLKAINYPATGNRTEITYDGYGRRSRVVEKSGSIISSVKNFLWDGLLLSAELDGNGQITKRFLPQGTQILSGSAPGSYYYTQDHLGSIREMTDASGAVRVVYDYDPYGRQTKVSGDVDADFGFTGYYQHAPSGLSLAPLREYDANLGRWISRDPLGEQGPDGPNLYHYAANNPVNATDPLGLACFEYNVFGNLDLKTLYAALEKKYGVHYLDHILDFLDLEPLHEEIFFDDGSTAGFSPDGVTPLPFGPLQETYIKRDCGYDDCILKKVVALDNWPSWTYSIIGNNCQDWARQVRNDYNFLKNLPWVQEECHPCGKK